VDVEISPEPTPEERAAVLAALAASNGGGGPGPSEWWDAGIREAVELEAEDG
jgi:hypothetical protein